MIKKLLFLLVLLLTATTGAWAQDPTYSVKMANVTDAEAANWTIASGQSSVKGNEADGLTGLSEGAEVTVTYSGSKKVKSVKAVKKGGAPDPMLATPMTIEAITAGSIQVEHPKDGMQYSKNGGAKTAVTTSIDVAAGDKVQFYGNGTSITKYGDPVMDDCTMINGSGNGFTCKVYGNIMSLLDEENFATAKTLSDSYTFKFLFNNNPTLTDASRLLLPATQLQESCYMQMFNGCDALTAAPALPAETLAYGCYQQMFNGCTALTAAPVLPATKLVDYCYNSMFNCCSNLATVTCLATSGINKNNNNSTSYWLNNAGSAVQDAKTVYTVNTANWPSDFTVIPAGWTLVNIDN